MKTLDVIIKTISETTQLSSIMAAKNSISSSGSSSSSSGGKFGRLTTSGPHETTRLLLDSARVARETEQIGG